MLTCAQHNQSFLTADAYLAHLIADHGGTSKLTGWLARGRSLLSIPVVGCVPAAPGPCQTSVALVGTRPTAGIDPTS